jgi:capsular polysaccharide biosynthesis protein
MRVPTDVPRLRDYLSMLRRAWVFILVTTLVSAAAAIAAVELRKPTYSASVMLFATVAGDPSTFASYYGSLGAKSRIPTYADLAKSTLVARRTIDQLKLSTSVEDLVSRVSAQWVPGGADRRGQANSVVLRISVTSDQPDLAIKEANAVADNLRVLSQELEWHESKPEDEIQYKGAVAELTAVGTARTAQLVPAPVLRSAAIGGGVGLAISVVIMLAVEIARDTVASRGQLDHIVRRATQGNT